MQVLHVITGLSTGGAQRELYNILSGGMAEKPDPAVVSLRDEGAMGPQIRSLGVSFYTLNMRFRMPAPKVIGRLRSIVRYINPNLIQGWMYHGNLAARLAAWFALGRPAVVWNVRHSLYDLAAEKPLTRQVIRVNRWLSSRPNAIIYNSRLSKSQHESFGFDATRSLVIPNGFDLEQLKPDKESSNSVRREFGFPEDALVVGHVARFHPMKDHASFLRAAVQVVFNMPSVHFLLIGREVSPENPTLSGIIPQDLVKRFVFLGERQDIYTLMQAMDVLVSSSAWGESFPNVLGEAMACGIPCVATDVGVCREIIGDTGSIVPPSDSEVLAQGIIAMLEKSKEERCALGRAARKRVEANYSLETVVGEYTWLYNELDKRG